MTDFSRINVPDGATHYATETHMFFKKTDLGFLMYISADNWVQVSFVANSTSLERIPEDKAIKAIKVLDTLNRFDRKLQKLRAEVKKCSNLLHNAQKEADKLAPCKIGDVICLDKGGKATVQRLQYVGTQDNKALFDVTVFSNNEYEIIKMVRSL